MSKYADIEQIKKIIKKIHNYADREGSLRELEITPTIEVSEDMGEVSDGYHTFNQLYHQRAVLFATIVNQNKDKAWKSWKHEDGKFCFDKGGEWFIVGIDTPEGSYTYHYEQVYWDMFDCEELDMGKHWDGHTEEDVTRLLSLPPVGEDCSDYYKGYCARYEDGCFHQCEDAPSVLPKAKEGEWEVIPRIPLDNYMCSKCGGYSNFDFNYCPNCGADNRPKLAGKHADQIIIDEAVADMRGSDNE